MADAYSQHDAYGIPFSGTLSRLWVEPNFDLLDRFRATPDGVSFKRADERARASMDTYESSATFRGKDTRSRTWLSQPNPRQPVGENHTSCLGHLEARLPAIPMLWERPAASVCVAGAAPRRHPTRGRLGAA